MSLAPGHPARSLNAFQIVIIGYTVLTLVGSFLLGLPAAHRGGPHAWYDDLFMAASALTTTGLATLDPSTRYSALGQVMLMTLMEVGGLGYMTVFTLGMVAIGRRMALRDRLNLQEALDQPGMSGLVSFVKSIVRFSLAMQAIGFVLMLPVTVPEFGWRQGAYVALFQSVAAFTNGGFALFPEGAVRWQSHAYMLLVLTLLVVVAGLGFNVNRELVNRHLLRRPPNPRWNLLIGIVVSWTAVLLVLATLLYWVSEAFNPRTLGPLSWDLQLVNSLFMAAQPRSGGLNSIDVGAMSEASLLITILLMFVGGGPGSTASGVKVTTIAVVWAAILASLRGQDDINLYYFRRRIGHRLVFRAVTVLVLTTAAIVLITGFLTTIEPHAFLAIVFETVSAFANVGLSMGITAELSPVSKVVLVVGMIIGRVGVLSVLLAIFTTRRKTTLRYAEEPLLVG